MDDAVHEQQEDLSENDSWLAPIIASLPILADISRADILLFRRQDHDTARVIAQARPHSVPPVHQETLIGQSISFQAYPAVWKVLRHGRTVKSVHRVSAHRTHVTQEIFPVRSADEQVVGALSLEKSLIEHERHRHRHSNFQKMLHELVLMVLRQGLPEVEKLTPFGEQDGLMVVDNQGRILYMSGLATKLYRKLGYTDNLVGKSLTDIDTGDAALMRQALDKETCLEEESEEGEYYWSRKVIPLVGPFWRFPFLDNKWFSGWRDNRPVGVLIMLHDNTRARRIAQEKAVRAAMIQEIHHRVKNNLQTIASLLRLQSRRLDEPQVQAILDESVNRILSIAVVHEFLSQHEGQIINVKEVACRIANQFKQSVLNPGHQVNLVVDGTSVFLPAKQATSCALVINELVQNALEHAYNEGEAGTVFIFLQDEGDMLSIRVQDDGRGLPPDFDLKGDSNLGLHIVRTLVEQDLQGEFAFRNQQGVCAVARIPKVTHNNE